MNAITKIPVTHKTAAPSRRTFNMFGSLQREIDHLFEDFAPAFGLSRGLGDVRCKMDLAESAKGLELTVELPGLEEKDVKVSVADGVLTVSGEKKFDSEKKDKDYHFVERGYGGFSRSIDLPAGVKTDQIQANLAKGVLTVAIPTPAKAEPKKIEIHSAA